MIYSGDTPFWSETLDLLPAILREYMPDAVAFIVLRKSYEFPGRKTSETIKLQSLSVFSCNLNGQKDHLKIAHSSL